MSLSARNKWPVLTIVHTLQHRRFVQVPRGLLQKDRLRRPSLSCFQFAAENNNGTNSSALLRTHSPAVTVSITASRCISVRRFLTTFSLLLQKAKPESGIRGRGEGERVGDAIAAGERVKQQLWGLAPLPGLHAGWLWAVLGFCLLADRSAHASSPSRFHHSLNL